MRKYLVLFVVLFGLFAFGTITHADSVNHAPLFSSTPVTSFESGKQYVYQVTGFDSDGDSLSFSITEGPSGMNLSPANVLTWTTTDAGLYNIVLQVTDNKGGYGSQSFQLIVNASDLKTLIITPNDRPTVVDKGTKTPFLVRGFDQYGNEISSPDVVWTSDLKVGSIDQGGVFVASHGGIGYVAANQGKVRTSIGVVVRDAVAEAARDNPQQTDAPTNTAQGEAATITIQPTNTESTKPSSDQGATTQTAATDKEAICTNWPTRTIWFLFILYTVVLLGYFWYTKGYKGTYWWVAPALLTIFFLILYSAQFCQNTYLWIPWLVLGIGTLCSIVYLFWMRQRSGEQEKLPL